MTREELLELATTFRDAAATTNANSAPSTPLSTPLVLLERCLLDEMPLDGAALLASLGGVQQSLDEEGLLVHAEDEVLAAPQARATVPHSLRGQVALILERI